MKLGQNGPEIESSVFSHLTKVTISFAHSISRAHLTSYKPYKIYQNSPLDLIDADFPQTKQIFTFLNVEKALNFK